MPRLLSADRCLGSSLPWPSDFSDTGRRPRGRTLGGPGRPGPGPRGGCRPPTPLRRGRPGPRRRRRRRRLGRRRGRGSRPFDPGASRLGSRGHRVPPSSRPSGPPLLSAGTRSSASCDVHRRQRLWWLASRLRNGTRKKTNHAAKTLVWKWTRGPTPLSTSLPVPSGRSFLRSRAPRAEAPRGVQGRDRRRGGSSASPGPAPRRPPRPRRCSPCVDEVARREGPVPSSGSVRGECVLFHYFTGAVLELPSGLSQSDRRRDGASPQTPSVYTLSHVRVSALKATSHTPGSHAHATSFSLLPSPFTLLSAPPS